MEDQPGPETNVNVSSDGILKGNGLGIYHNVLGFWNGNGKWKIDNWSLWMQEWVEDSRERQPSLNNTNCRFIHSITFFFIGFIQ